MKNTTEKDKRVIIAIIKHFFQNVYKIPLNNPRYIYQLFFFAISIVSILKLFAYTTIEYIQKPKKSWNIMENS